MIRKVIVDHRIKAKDVIETPHVVFVQKFNDQAVKDFREDMEKAHKTGQTVIPVIIDSYGGSVYACLDMISQMQASSLPVHTVVMGKAMSAGAILFSMGEQRHISPNGTIMVHDASTFAMGKVEDIKVDAHEIDRLNKLMYGLLAKNCGHKDDYFLNLIHQKGHTDWYLNPKECKKHNLCTHIGIPEFKVEVSVNYKFG